MAFKLDASAYQQELDKSSPTSIDQIIASMQKVSPEAKAAMFGKLGTKYATTPQALTALYAAYPEGVATSIIRVVPAAMFLDYAENGYAPVMDMGEDSFVVMDTKTGLFHQYNRKAQAINSNDGVSFDKVLLDIKAEENWQVAMANMKSTFAGLAEATEALNLSSAALETSKSIKAKIQHALDVVAKEGWDENKPYELGFGTSIASICKVKNSLVTAQQATSALESLMDKELLSIEGLDIDWQKKWETVKDWFRKFWKAIKDFFQAMWVKIRSYIGSDREFYKAVDIISTVAKEAGLASELDKLGKTITFDATTSTFVFPDDVKQSTIDVFKAKIAALPENKKVFIKKLLNPNYQEATASGGLAGDQKTTTPVTTDKDLDYKKESESVQNSMSACACISVAEEVFTIKRGTNSFIEYDTVPDMFNTISKLVGNVNGAFTVVKDDLANGTISKKEIDAWKNKVDVNKPMQNKYADTTISSVSDPSGKLTFTITLDIHTAEPNSNNMWTLQQMMEFVKRCDEAGIPENEKQLNAVVQNGDYILNRLEVIKFAEDVTTEDAEFFKNRMISVSGIFKDLIGVGTKIISHIIELRASCVKAIRDLETNVVAKAVEAV